jgi:hypothetical protein
LAEEAKERLDTCGACAALCEIATAVGTAQSHRLIGAGYRLEAYATFAARRHHATWASQNVEM